MSNTSNLENLLIRWTAPVAGVIFFLLFVSLGIWQLGRALEKNALRETLENPGQYVPLDEVSEPGRYQAVAVTGEYLAEQQVLIRNVIKNDRVGYYVITALRQPDLSSIVVVNRGWIPRASDTKDLADISVQRGRRVVRGRIGGLPRVGIRSGPVFGDDSSWPRTAAWPELADLASAWNVDVAPVVVLLDPEEADGFLRQWQPPDSGSMMHYSYAIQWLVMALAVLAVTLWQLRKRLLARRIAAG